MVFVKMLESPKSWQELASKAHWPPARTGLQDVLQSGSESEWIPKI